MTSRAVDWTTIEKLAIVLNLPSLGGQQPLAAKKAAKLILDLSNCCRAPTKLERPRKQILTESRSHLDRPTGYTLTKSTYYGGFITALGLLGDQSNEDRWVEWGCFNGIDKQPGFTSLDCY